MQGHRRFGSWLAVLLLAPLLGCAGFLGDKRESVEDAIEDYSTFLRWGALDRAKVFVEPLKRPEFMAFFETGRPYQFTAVEVGTIDYDADTLMATSPVRFTLYRLTQATLTTIVDVQRWRYDPDGGWLVDPDLDTFRSSSR